ncbi:MAG TPA: zinc-binding dehydrogenase, partial [Gemmataceae bacterium]
FWLGAWARQQGPLTMLRLFRRVGVLMREGVLESPIAATYPLDQVREAARHATAEAKGGKVLLRIGTREGGESLT